MVAVLVDLAACPEANLEEGTLNAHMLSITWKRIRTKWARTLPEWVTRFSSASGDAGAGAGAVKAELTKARTRAKYVNGAIAIWWAQRRERQTESRRLAAQR